MFFVLLSVAAIFFAQLNFFRAAFCEVKFSVGLPSLLVLCGSRFCCAAGFFEGPSLACLVGMLFLFVKRDLFFLLPMAAIPLVQLDLFRACRWHASSGC